MLSTIFNLWNTFLAKWNETTNVDDAIDSLITEANQLTTVLCMDDYYEDLYGRVNTLYRWSLTPQQIANTFGNLHHGFLYMDGVLFARISNEPTNAWEAWNVGDRLTMDEFAVLCTKYIAFRNANAVNPDNNDKRTHIVISYDENKFSRNLSAMTMIPGQEFFRATWSPNNAADFGADGQSLEQEMNDILHLIEDNFGMPDIAMGDEGKKYTSATWVLDNCHADFICSLFE